MHEPIIWFCGFDVGGASINHDNYTNHSCLLIVVLSGRMLIDRYPVDVLDSSTWCPRAQLQHAKDRYAKICPKKVPLIER